jgi:hypothetical protein
MIELTEKQVNQFASLINQLSPENLFCDGEITRSQASKRERQIKKKWRDLELDFGRSVTESEVLFRLYTSCGQGS